MVGPEFVNNSNANEETSKKLQDIATKVMEVVSEADGTAIVLFGEKDACAIGLHGRGDRLVEILVNIHRELLHRVFLSQGAPFSEEAREYLETKIDSIDLGKWLQSAIKMSPNSNAIIEALEQAFGGLGEAAKKMTEEEKRSGRAGGLNVN